MDDNEKYKSIFNNLTDEDFEDILKECNFKYEKVEKGKGGLFVDGKRIESDKIFEEYSYFKGVDK
jgi:hypothetical protein